MAINVTHSKVSTIPDGDDTSLIRPSDWNDDHVIVGLGTMAEQNANAVAITGGTISGVTVSGYIPTTEKAQPLGVATLDAGGKVPTSQIPQMGDLNYQGTWNATTNSPTLTSSVGTKGYYYVVSVAGTTNLNGITDWQIGDWAIFNGSTWEKVDNTDAVTSVNGYTGTVVLNAADVGAIAKIASSTDNAITRFDGTTGGLVQNSVVTISDTGAIDGATTITNLDYLDFDTTYATTLGAGQLGWNGNDTLGLGMIGGNVVQHIGEDTYFYVKSSSAITKGQLCMFTGAVGSSGVLTAAPSTAIPYAEAIIGVAAEDIALGNFGLIQSVGTLRGVDTSAFLDGDILYYNSAVTGGFTKTYPASGPVVIVAAVAKSGAGSSGVLTIRVSFQTRVTGSTGLSVVQANDTVALTNTGVTSLTAGTGISVSGATGGVTVTNTAPDQVVSITGAGTTTVTGTYPNFTVTSNDQYVGTVTSVAATAGTGISITGSPITTSGTLNITNTAPDQIVSLTGAGTTTVTGTYPNFTITSNDSTLGTVTSVAALTIGTSGTDLSSTVANSTTTPVITLNVPTASATNRGALSAADWTTFNNKASVDDAYFVSFMMG